MGRSGRRPDRGLTWAWATGSCSGEGARAAPSSRPGRGRGRSLVWARTSWSVAMQMSDSTERKVRAVSTPSFSATSRRCRSRVMLDTFPHRFSTVVHPRRWAVSPEPSAAAAKAGLLKAHPSRSQSEPRAVGRCRVRVPPTGWMIMTASTTAGGPSCHARCVSSPHHHRLAAGADTIRTSLVPKW